MLKQVAVLLFGVVLAGAGTCQAAESFTLPDSWLGEQQDSVITISYEDLDYVLEKSVLMSGPPNRKKSKASSSGVNTRLKNNFNPLTANAGNRLFYEEYKKDPEMAKVISRIRASLEAVPGEVNLNSLSKKEQIAYWLNLYNVVVIDEINKVYPLKNMEDFVTGPDGLLERKIIRLEGQLLSLNDIQYGVLKEKYPDDLLILYGFYQGYIGSPSIRKHAYTGSNLYRSLQFNANDFINSNRGTYPDGKEFRVAAYYTRNKAYFPDFENDLKAHLREYLREKDLDDLDKANTLIANLDDWSVTDIYGTSRAYGTASANNDAALLDAFSQAAAPTGSEQIANFGQMSETLGHRASSYGRFSVDQVVKLRELKQNHENRGGVITVTDLDEGNNEKPVQQDKSGQ